MHTTNARRRANRTRCRLTDCNKFAQTRGLCKAHGGGSRCRHLECNKLAQSRGLCIAHGGGRRCTIEDCNKLAQSRGHCISHGGGRRCAVPQCDKFAQVRGYCKAHAKVLMVFRSPLSPTHAALMTPPASTFSSPTISLSPVKSKLSIDFLVNPSQPRSMSSETQRPRLMTMQNLMPPAQSTVSYPRKVFNQQPSLLSYLEHGSSTSTVTRSQLPELKLSSTAFPPLVLYRSA